MRRAKDGLRLWLARRGYNFYKMAPDEQREVLASWEAPTREDESAAAVPARLEELRRRYAALDLAATRHSAWARRGSGGDRVDTGLGLDGIDLSAFRAQNSFTWAYLGSNPVAVRLRYYLFADYVRRTANGLFGALTEDGAFGCPCFDYPGMPRISRDLLDSVLELAFLERHVGLLRRDDLRVLDVGAGYGRLAYRTLSAGAKPARYDCVDAVAESTYLCERYLGFRSCLGRARVLPLDEFSAGAGEARYDLAVNVHSFSECTHDAIAWWIDRLVERGVTHLLIVPNEGDQLLSRETDKSRRDFSHVLRDAGFALEVSEPVIADPAVRSLLLVDDQLLLFRRR